MSIVQQHSVHVVCDGCDLKSNNVCASDRDRATIDVWSKLKASGWGTRLVTDYKM